MVSETRKRGTVERRFRTTARRFEVDQSLFSADNLEETDQLIDDLFRQSEHELKTALTRTEESEPLVVRLALKGSPERIEALQQELLKWIEMSSAEQDEPTGDEIEAAGLIAFYRIHPD